MDIRIKGPADGADLTTPYLVTVRCPHGVTRLPVRRTCRNGCHMGGAARAERCPVVNPSPEMLEGYGALAHGQSLRCGCDEEYWMAVGPLHSFPRDDGAWDYEIQVDELMLENEEYEDLVTAGPSRSPWGPVC